MQDYLEIIGAALGGGGLTAFINFVIAKNQGKRDNFDKIISTWEKDNERLRVDQERSKKEIITLQADVYSLRNKLILMESAHIDLPIPMWLKDTDCKMLALNQAYEDIFLTPNGKTAQDYIGKFDIDVWPKDIATAYVKNDKKVLMSGIVLDKNETVLINGQEEEMRIIKYVRYAGTTRIGIAGIAIPNKIVH